MDYPCLHKHVPDSVETWVPGTNLVNNTFSEQQLFQGTRKHGTGNGPKPSSQGSSDVEGRREMNPRGALSGVQLGPLLE